MNVPPATMTSFASIRLRSPEVLDVFDAGRARALHQESRRLGAGLDREVMTALGRPQIGARGRRAPPVADGVLAAAETFLLLAVVILGEGIAGLLRRLEPGVEDRIGRLGELRAERPLAAAPGVRAVFPGLGAIEVGQHVGIGPAARALLRPAIVIAAVAARIGHDVDRRRTAEHLAAHRLDPAVVEIGFGLGLIAPIEHRLVVHPSHAKRDRNIGMPVRRPGFEQQHGRAVILGEPVGEHAAGGPRPHDDVVIPVGHACPVSL